MAHDSGKTSVDAFLAEYTALKTEQAGRIGIRDNLIYAALGAVAAIAYGAVQLHQVLLLLAIAPSGAIIGWLYRSNDRMITWIGQYIGRDLGPRLVKTLGAAEPIWRWETEDASGRTIRKVIQLAMDLLTFVTPGLVAVVVVSLHPNIPAWAVAACVADVLLASVVGWQICVSAEIRQGP